MRFLAVAVAALTSLSVSAQVYVQSGLVHDFQVSAAGQLEGVTSVVNAGDEDRRIRVYLTDYSFSSDGTTLYGKPGSQPRSAASWVTIGAPEIVVPVGETTDVRYLINVPDLDRTGTWWCTLMVEDMGSNTQQLDGPYPSGIQRRTRFAIQLVFEFGGEQPVLALEDLRLSQPENGQNHLQIDVVNSGGTLADTDLLLELFTLEGVSRGVIRGSRARLYPSTSYQHVVDLSTVPPGQYQALVIVDTDDQNGIGSQFVLDL